MLKLSGISKIYHNKYEDHLALDNINIFIKENKGITFILGPSGSGKTTLLNILSDKDKDFSGQKEIEGNLVHISQEFLLFENMSLLDNLLIIENDPLKIEKFLKIFKLDTFKDRKVYKLSNGQKKRVELIKGLLLNPDILLCDELTSALDHDNSILMMDILKTLSKAILVIMVTHDEDLANNYADRIIRISNSKIISDEVINDVKSQRILKKSDLFKDLKDHITLVLKDLKSRMVYFTFFVISLVLCVISIYISLNLYETIKSQNTLYNTFKYGRNMIEIDTPKKEDTSHFNRSELDIYTTDNFDLYYPDDINSFIKDNDNLIAVEAYWDNTKNKYIRINRNYTANEDNYIYSDLSIWNDETYGSYQFIQKTDLPYVGAFKNVYYDDHDFYVESEDNLAFKNSTSFKEEYRFMLNGLEHKKEPYDPKTMFHDFSQNNFVVSRDVINLHPYRTPFIFFDNFESNYIDNYKQYTYERNGRVHDAYEDYSVHFYYLLNDYELPLLYGAMPQREDEIVLDLNTAELYAKESGISQEELIGKEIKLIIYADPIIDNTTVSPSEYQMIEEQFDFSYRDLLEIELNYKISGISTIQTADKRAVYSIESFDDNQIINSFKSELVSDEYENVLADNPFIDNYPFFVNGIEIPEEQIGSIYYDKVSFLLEPGCDYNKVLEKTIEYYRPQYDSFVIYGDVNDDSGLFYKNINVFFPFILSVTLLIISIPYIMAIYDRKRDHKENNLSIDYGYRLNLIYLIKYLFIFIFTALLSSVVIYIIAQYLNMMANEYNYVSFITFDGVIYIAIITATILLTALFRKIISR